MKVRMIILLLLLAVPFITKSQGIFPGGVDEWRTGTTYAETYYIGYTNDICAGQPEQYILVIPIITGGNAHSAAGLSGTLTFYRGSNSSYNFNGEYRINFQSAWGTNNLYVIPLNSASGFLNVYSVQYNGTYYAALKVREILCSPFAANFTGHWWNNVDGTKPRLVLASDVSNVTIIQDVQSAFGNRIFVRNNGNVGIGTETPNAVLNVDPKGNGGISIGNSNGTSQGYTSMFMSISAEKDGYGQIQAVKSAGSSWGDIFMNPNGGNVGIGTTDTKNYKLAVAGSMIAEKVKVKLQSGWPDFVFEQQYPLRSLKELENFIKTNKHLPDMPAAAAVEKEGMDVGEINKLLLQKIEELTLYIIDQQKQITELKEEVRSRK